MNHALLNMAIVVNEVMNNFKPKNKGKLNQF